MAELFLRFDDRIEAISAMGELGILPDGDRWPSTGQSDSGIGYALDLVFGTGTILRPTGEMLESELGPVPAMAPVSGYHLNMVWQDEAVPPALLSFTLEPTSPALVWATGVNA